MKKRILSIVLAICLVLTLVPTTAFAEFTQKVYVVAGSSELCGILWEGNPTKSPGNVMSDNGNGTYTKVYTDVAVMDGYQFKVVENTLDGELTWHGLDNGNNVTFNVKSVCDVTITFDSATHKIFVEGAGVELVSGLNIESIRTVGNGGRNWLNGIAWDPSADKNLMTEVSSGVYEITYTDIEALDNYEFKFAANGSWNDFWGGAYAGSGVESDAVYNGKNIIVSVPYELADVTIRLDLTNFEFATKTGAKFTVTVTNKAKSDFTYTVSDDNKVTITGYTGSATDVVIPDTIDGKPVKAIGAYAFKNKAITSVTIPNSVTSIGTEAFYNCRSLTSIDIPGSVTSIGTEAFYNCRSLTSIDIPGSVTSIGTEAFYDCRSLTSIDIPGSVTSIGASAFAFCDLASVTLRHGVTYIGDHAFNNCHRLTSIDIPGSVTSIGTAAFASCDSLTSVTLRHGVTYIGDHAFQNCPNLISIEIPGSVMSIETAAFFGCYGLESIFLPNDLNADIPNTTSQVRYRLDETAGEVTITEIALGIDKTGVAIPATICGYPVVAISNEGLLTKISSHTCVGGQATCQNKAICRICEQEYGEKNSNNHTGKLVWATTETQHKKYWGCCNAVVVDYEDHTWTNGVCSECDYTCTHKDTDKNHVCDYCDANVGTHADINLDHKCDYGCSEAIGTHADTNNDHKCDYGCSEAIGTHADINLDHKCDYGCSEAIGTHEDTNSDHKCDYGCNEAIGAHADINKDHKCDYGCSEAIGVHADINKDHKCDYGCSESIGAHEDTNSDHNCDYCHEQMTTCTDENPKDHICDICTATLSQHSGGFSTCSSRAKCNYCGQRYGTLDHNWHHLEHINAVPATSSKPGNKEYWHCLDCDRYFADEKGETLINLADTVTAKLPPSNEITYKGETIKPNANGEYVSKEAKRPVITNRKGYKKAFKVTWKKISGVSGYQIQYSTSKKFTKKTTKAVYSKGNKKYTKTVKKLKSKKKYYVRVRTYKKVNINGKTTKIYSSWSKAKYVTTKK